MLQALAVFAPVSVLFPLPPMALTILVAVPPTLVALLVCRLMLMLVE
jgi:hypothetical protein